MQVQGGISGSKTYGYDANGNVTSLNNNGTTIVLRWDDEGQPYWIGYGNGRYSDNGYNGLGQRTFHQDAPGHGFPQAYDGASLGAALLSSAGTLFTPGLMHQDTSGQHFYQTDALGSVRGVSGSCTSGATLSWRRT